MFCQNIWRSFSMLLREEALERFLIQTLPKRLRTFWFPNAVCWWNSSPNSTWSASPPGSVGAWQLVWKVAGFGWAAKLLQSNIPGEWLHFNFSHIFSKALMHPKYKYNTIYSNNDSFQDISTKFPASWILPQLGKLNLTLAKVKQLDNSKSVP